MISQKESIGKALVRKGKPPIKKLAEFRIPDSPSDWLALGFHVTYPKAGVATSNPKFPFVKLDNIILYLIGKSTKTTGWSFETYPAHHGDMHFQFEGIPTCLISERDLERNDLLGLQGTSSAPAHPNCVSRLKRVVISRKDDFKKTFGGLMAMMEMEVISPPGSKTGPVIHRGATMFAYFKNPESGIIVELVSAGKDDDHTGIVGLVMEATKPLEYISCFKSEIKTTVQDPLVRIVEIGSSTSQLSLRLAIVHKDSSKSHL